MQVMAPPLAGEASRSWRTALCAPLQSAAEIVGLLQMMAPPDKQEQAKRVKDNLEQARGLVSTNPKDIRPEGGMVEEDVGHQGHEDQNEAQSISMDSGA